MEIESLEEAKEEIRWLKEENVRLLKVNQTKLEWWESIKADYDRLKTLEDKLLYYPYLCEDTLVSLHEVWNNLPSCSLLLVISMAIQTIQYYQAKEENCEEI